MQEGDDLILRFEIAPADARGNLVLGFEVADDFGRRNRACGMFLRAIVEHLSLRRYRDCYQLIGTASSRCYQPL